MSRTRRLSLRVIDDAAVPENATLICVRAGRSLFDDDMAGMCSECGAAILFRPDVAHVKRKVCLPCLRRAKHLPGESLVTRRALNETRLYLSNTRGKA